MELLDAEVIEKRDLGVDEIGGVQVGEGRAKRLAGFGIDGGGAGGAVAAAEVVGADDEEAVGVDGFAWADDGRPPAGVDFFGPEIDAFGWVGVGAGGVMGSRERVVEKNGVGSVFVEGAPGGVGELCSGNASAFAESEIAERKKGSGVVGHGQRVKGNLVF